MRIVALFRGRLAESRGTPSRSRNLIRALIAAGNDVLVMSGDPAGTLEGVLEAPQLPLAGDPVAQLTEAVDRHHPDLLYGQANKAAFLLNSLGASKAIKVVDLHGDLAAEKLEQTWKPLPRRLLGFTRQRLEERRAFQSIDAFTTASEPLARRTSRLGKPTAVIWGGVDPQVFAAPAAQLGKTVTVGYAGNFRPYQGLPVLVEAMARLDETYRLLLVGDPTGGEDLARRAHEALGNRLTVLPPVPYAEIPAILGGADTLVVPRPDSRSGRYGFPSKLPEYLALGRPVVVTDVGDQARVVRDGDNGLVVPAGSVGALARALGSLADPELRRRLGGAGRRSAVDQLSWDHVGQRLQTFLGSLVDEGLEPRPQTAGLATSVRGK